MDINKKRRVNMRLSAHVFRQEVCKTAQLSEAVSNRKETECDHLLILFVVCSTECRTI